MNAEYFLHGINCFLHGSLKQRLNAFINLAVERPLGLACLSSMPVVLQLELTNACNLNCEMCSRHWAKLETGEMSDAIIEKAVKLFDFASEVALFGYGEPLLSKRFFKLLEIARQKKVRTSFFSNALLLDKKTAEKIIKAGVSSITFSLDGATAKTYNSIRRGSDFERVTKNIRGFVEAKEELHSVKPDLRIEFVAMRQNIEELPLLVEIVASLGIKKLKVSHLVVWNKGFEKQSLLFHKNLCHEIFERAKQSAVQFGVSLDLPVDFLTAKGNENQPACFDPWYYVYIRFDGIVQACCYTNSFEMGDLNKQAFSEIWNNQKYRQLRRKVNSRELPFACQACEKRFKKIKNKKLKESLLKFTPRLK